MLIAEYTAPTKRLSGAVTIAYLLDGNRQIVEVIPVDGKRMARATARDLNAKPWNF